MRFSHVKVWTPLPLLVIPWLALSEYKSYTNIRGKVSVVERTGQPGTATSFNVIREAVFGRLLDCFILVHVGDCLWHSRKMSFTMWLA